MKRQGERKNESPGGMSEGFVCISEVFCVQEWELNMCVGSLGAAHKHLKSHENPASFHLEATGTSTPAQQPPGLHTPDTWQRCRLSRPAAPPEGGGVKWRGTGLNADPD